MMLTRLLIATFFAALPISASALDDSDEGTYALVHVDVHVTQKHIRLLRHGNGWIALDASGPTNPNECPSCLLESSTLADVERFLGGPAPEGMSAECANNDQMAICRVMEGRGPEASRQYGFIALTEGTPVYVKLTRLNGSK